MPAWSQEDAGPLSTYQIGQLVTMVQSSDWQATAPRVAALGLEPTLMIAIVADATAVSQVISYQMVIHWPRRCRSLRLIAWLVMAPTGPARPWPGLQHALHAGERGAMIERTIANGVAGTLMSGWSGVLGSSGDYTPGGVRKGLREDPGRRNCGAGYADPGHRRKPGVGRSLYAGSCTSCHGPDGQGTPRAPSLNVKGFLTATNDAAMQQIITMGVLGTAMPAWGDRLSETEIQALGGFIRAGKPNAPDVATPSVDPAGSGGTSNTTTGSSDRRRSARLAAPAVMAAGSSAANVLGASVVLAARVGLASVLAVRVVHDLDPGRLTQS